MTESMNLNQKALEAASYRLKEISRQSGGYGMGHLTAFSWSEAIIQAYLSALPPADERELLDAIMEQLPSFGVGVNNPDDIGNTKYAMSIAKNIIKAILPLIRGKLDSSLPPDEPNQKPAPQ